MPLKEGSVPFSHILKPRTNPSFQPWRENGMSILILIHIVLQKYSPLKLFPCFVVLQLGIWNGLFSIHRRFVSISFGHTDIFRIPRKFLLSEWMEAIDWEAVSSGIIINPHSDWDLGIWSFLHIQALGFETKKHSFANMPMVIAMLEGKPSTPDLLHSTLTSFPVLADKKLPHDMTLPPQWRWRLEGDSFIHSFIRDRVELVSQKC